MQTITVKSPLRICLAGGASDIPEHWRRSGGFLVSAAIDKFLTVEIKDAYFPIVASEPTTMRYATAAGFNGGMIDVTSDIPPGSGMGGSGSLMVSLLRARHPDLQASELAAAAYNLERYALSQPTGIQDAYIAAYGGCLAMELDTYGRVATWQVKLPDDFHARLLLMATGIQRPAADVLRKQAAETSTKLVCREAMERIAGLGHEIYHDLRDNAGRRFGELTDTHWQYKRATTSAISNPAIDAWYDLAKENGAEGAKLIGAGGGGFFLFVVPPDRRYHLVETMTAAGLTELPFQFTDQGARIIK